MRDSNATVAARRRDASSFLPVYLDLRTPQSVLCPSEGDADRYAPDDQGVSRLSTVGSISTIAPQVPR